MAAPSRGASPRAESGLDRAFDRRTIIRTDVRMIVACVLIPRFSLRAAAGRAWRPEEPAALAPLRVPGHVEAERLADGPWRQPRRNAERHSTPDQAVERQLVRRGPDARRPSYSHAAPHAKEKSGQLLPSSHLDCRA
jgi:hypothetical protein